MTWADTKHPLRINCDLHVKGPVTPQGFLYINPGKAPYRKHSVGHVFHVTYFTPPSLHGEAVVIKHVEKTGDNSNIIGDVVTRSVREPLLLGVLLEIRIFVEKMCEKNKWPQGMVEINILSRKEVEILK